MPRLTLILAWSTIVLLLCSLFNPLYAAQNQNTDEYRIEHPCLVLPGKWTNYERDVLAKWCKADANTIFVVDSSFKLLDETAYEADPLARRNEATTRCTQVWKDPRKTLSGTFVSAVLSSPSVMEYVKTKGVLDWSNFIVVGDVVANKGIIFSLKLSKVLFCGHVDFSKSTGSFNLSIKQAVALGKPCNCSKNHGLGRIDLSYSSFSSVNFNGVHAAVIDALWINVTHNFMVIHSHIGHVRLEHAQVTGRLSLENSRQKAKYFEHYKGPNPERQYGNWVNLNFAQVAAQLRLDQFESDGPVSIFHGAIGDLTVRCSTIPAFDFRNLNVSADVRFAKATLGFKGNDFAPHCEPSAVPKKRRNGLLAMQMRVGGSLYLKSRQECKWNVPKDDPVYPVNVLGPLCLSGVMIQQNLDISGIVANRLVLNGAKISGSLIFKSEISQAQWRTNEKGVAPKIDLRGADIGSIRSCFTVKVSGTKDSQSDWPALRLFSEAKIGIMTFLKCVPNYNQLEVIESEVEIKTKVISFLDQGMLASEAIGGYRSFAKIYESQDRTTIANGIKFAKEARITRDSDGWQKLPRFIKLLFGGYGVAPKYPFWTAVSFIVFGMFMLRSSIDADAYFEEKAYVSNREFWVYLEMFVISIDRLIPIVTFSREHSNIAFDNQQWIRLYFYLHTFVGWLLASMIFLYLGQILGISA